MMGTVRKRNRQSGEVSLSVGRLVRIGRYYVKPRTELKCENECNKGCDTTRNKRAACVVCNAFFPLHYAESFPSRNTQRTLFCPGKLWRRCFRQILYLRNKGHLLYLLHVNTAFILLWCYPLQLNSYSFPFRQTFLWSTSCLSKLVISHILVWVCLPEQSYLIKF